MEKKTAKALMITSVLFIISLSAFANNLYSASATTKSGVYERTDKKSTWLNWHKKGGIHYKIEYDLEKTPTVKQFKDWTPHCWFNIYDSDYMWRNTGYSFTVLYDEDYPDYAYALDIHTWGDLCLVDDTSSYYRLQSSVWFDNGEGSDHHDWDSDSYGDIRTLWWYGYRDWDKAF
ncbi:MAG: hypothetical protein ACTSWL_03315 [Promethearchaeota archaeon]